MMKLKEIDLTKGNKSNHPDIKTDGTYYLCKLGTGFFAGTFHKVWFGLSFNGWYAPLQFDTPGTNNSDWKKVWEIIESKEDKAIKSTAELKREENQRFIDSFTKEEKIIFENDSYDGISFYDTKKKILKRREKNVS